MIMMTRRTQSGTGEQGFTLLEMLVSVTLIAVMAVALWAVFRISINSWIRGTEFVDVNQRNRSILDLVKKQMASIHGVMVQADLQTGGLTYPVFFGTESSVQFISLNSLRFQDNPGLTHGLLRSRRRSPRGLLARSSGSGSTSGWIRRRRPSSTTGTSR